jgi:LmeA-like phospholipid-binding
VRDEPDRAGKCEAGRVRKGRGSGRAVKIAGGVVAAIVAVVALAQVLLPGIAARMVREKVERYGTVKSVKVKAWPAVKLVWGEADEVQVRAGQLKVSPEQAVALLKEAKGVNKMDTTAESVEVGGLRLTNTSLQKHGSALRAEGQVSEEDVKRALPEGVEVALVKSENGMVEVSASGGLFGVSASVDAVAKAQDGKLVAQPTAFLLDGLRLTVFEDPSVYVEGVQARALGSVQGAGARYELSMWASLR